MMLIYYWPIYLISLTFAKQTHGKVIRSSENVEAIQEGCGKTSRGIAIFPITGKLLSGKSIVFYNVIYNVTRGLAISTTAYHDSLNKMDNSDRKNDFRKYKNCPRLFEDKVQSDCSKSFKMTERQKGISGKMAYDRGHITPANPFVFDQNAVSSTFYCVNMAPQDPFLNQNPWRLIEDASADFLTAGYVMTGICASDSKDGPTRDGIPTPSCYWKLVCYKEDGETYVVGFIGNNTLTPGLDKEEKKRKFEETKTFRSQAQIIRKSGQGKRIKLGWQEASKVLLENRDQPDLAPDYEKCSIIKDLPDETAMRKWNSILKNKY